MNSVAARPGHGLVVQGELTQNEREDQRAAAVCLLRSWIKEDTALSEATDSWNELKQELDRDRGSSRRLFP